MSIGEKIISVIERFLSGITQDSSTKLPCIYLSIEVLHRTVNLLRSYRDKKGNHEGIVYWTGITTDKFWFITTCIAPKAVTSRGSFSTDIKANADVISFINKYGLHLLAQVHSHPGKNVNHSNGDDKNAFMPYDGFLSIIVPEYSVKGMRPLSICGIHRFTKGRFKRLSYEEIKNHFITLPLFEDMRYESTKEGFYV